MFASTIILTLLVAQQPAKPPAFPPINPGQARLDQTLNGLDAPGVALAVNEESGVLAAGCEQGTIQYWHKDVTMGIRAGANTAHVLHGHRGPVLALVWRGSLLASGGADQKVILWDLAASKPANTLTSAVPVRALTASPDGKLLASAGDDGAIQLWDTTAGKATT